MSDTWKCPFCDKELVLKNKYTKSGHLARCERWKKYKKIVLTKEYLKNEYIKKSRSALEIAKEHNLDSAVSIVNLLRQYDISLRTMSESAKVAGPKRRRTTKRRSGYDHNFCKSHPSRKKWEKKLLIEEGIVNVFQRKEVKEKIKEFWMDKLGVDHPMKDFDYLNSFFDNMEAKHGIRYPITKHSHTSPRRISSLNSKLYEVLTELEIPFIPEYEVATGVFVDVFVPKCNLSIEAYGDYWHCNPKMYKENDVFNRNSMKIKAKDKWVADQKRENIIITEGESNLLVVWESEFNDLEKIICEHVKFLE
jgi:hypothetical protein